MKKHDQIDRVEGISFSHICNRPAAFVKYVYF